MRRTWTIALAVLVALAALLGIARQVLYLKTQRAGFEPPPFGRARPSDFGMRYDSLRIASGDRSLEAWWIPAAGADSGAVLVFHGNAETLPDWVAAARLLHGHHLDVMLFDYSGYGHSTGTPSVDATIEDGVSALRAFERRAPRGLRRTGVGMSIGSAVLMEAADRYPGAVDAIALLEPFASGRETAVHLKMLPAWLAPLMPDAFDNVRRARSMRVPLLVVHSTGDRKFPIAFAREITDAARSPHELVVLDGYAHGDPHRKPDERYWAPVVAFATAR